MSHALFPDVIVAHHLDSVETIHTAVTGGATPDVPASTRRGWQARFRRNQHILESACAATAIALGGDVTEFGYPHVLAALWVAVQRRSDMTPPVWRIVNIISGMSWIRERVNSSWAARRSLSPSARTQQVAALTATQPTRSADTR